MNKSELINAISEKTNQPRKEVERTLNTFWDVVMDSLSKGETIALTGIGSFGTKQRAERTGQNPKTKEKMTIPATTVPYFKAGSRLKEAVAKAKE